MVFEKVAVEGYEALKKAIEGSRARTVILFTGSKDSGKSWCPDCIAAEPVIARVIGELSSSNFANEHDIRFIECSVGSREYWKNAKNPFRTDDHFKLSCIPTLIEYGVKGKKLSEVQLTNETLVKELLMDDE